ncbi:MAG TPA: SOS response-associated peptidase [Acidimicrobiia bacterium]|jgi:putative SOS response-associated peptidase YedK
MCGRFVAVSSPQLLVDHFDVDDVDDDAASHTADYNVTPRASVPVVLCRRRRRALAAARWGLVPSWADDLRVGDRLINARSETVASSSAFSAAYRRRRCVVAADGFYEWQRRPGRPKLPLFLHRADGEPLAFAGLWEAWRSPVEPDSEWVLTCTIVTTAAGPDVEGVHDRMPVVLDSDGWRTWLDDRADDRRLRPLMRPSPGGTLVRHAVARLVNEPGNNGPELVVPVEVDDEPGVLTLFE